MLTFLFWNLNRKPLERPELLSRFLNDDLEILVTDDETPFLSPKAQIRKRRVVSDHLPILFKLNL